MLPLRVSHKAFERSARELQVSSRNCSPGVELALSRRGKTPTPVKMLIPKKNRKEVYKYLFKEGVLYAEKDFNLDQHPEIEGVPNLQVIKLMQSFVSKELVTERFAWRHYYWFLTDSGIDYLREYLNLPSEIVPATLKKSTRPLERGVGDRPPRRDRDGGDRPPRRFDGPPGGYREGREGGRGGFGRGGGDKEGAPGAYRPEFRSGGGFGRGSAPPS